jgi:hypothetical protein
VLEVPGACGSRQGVYREAPRPISIVWMRAASDGRSPLKFRRTIR